MKPENLQDAHHPPAHTIRWHGGMTDEDVKNHLRKVVLTHHTYWDENLFLFLLASTAGAWCSEGSYTRPATYSPHPPNKEHPTTDVTDIVKRL
jgi:hypothetical protein